MILKMNYLMSPPHFLLCTETGVSGAQWSHAVLRSVSQRVTLQQPSPRTVPSALSLAPLSRCPLAQCTATNLAPRLSERSNCLYKQHEWRRRGWEVNRLLNTLTDTQTRARHSQYIVWRLLTHIHTHSSNKLDTETVALKDVANIQFRGWLWEMWFQAICLCCLGNRADRKKRKEERDEDLCTQCHILLISSI